MYESRLLPTPATGDIFEKTGSAIGLGPLPVNSGALPDSKRD
jgi:hypothetical protein